MAMELNRGGVAHVEKMCDLVLRFVKILYPSAADSAVYRHVSYPPNLYRKGTKVREANEKPIPGEFLKKGLKQESWLDEVGKWVDALLDEKRGWEDSEQAKERQARDGLVEILDEHARSFPTEDIQAKVAEIKEMVKENMPLLEIMEKISNETDIGREVVTLRFNSGADMRRTMEALFFEEYGDIARYVEIHADGEIIDYDLTGICAILKRAGIKILEPRNVKRDDFIQIDAFQPGLEEKLKRAMEVAAVNIATEALYRAGQDHVPDLLKMLANKLGFRAKITEARRSGEEKEGGERSV